jgi:pimeloyl-ACP methyl ester carboxylesterase
MTALRSPVVMIHGAFCGGWAFESWKTVFKSKGYDAHTPDLRFHDGGKEPPPALGQTSMLDYVEDLGALLDDFDKKPILIGHSMGGLLAQMLAARRHVRALVLLSPCAPWGVLPATPFEYASAQALYLAGDFWNRTLWPTHWIAAANALDNVPEPERQAVLDRFVPESGLATFEIMHWAFDLKRATQIDPRDVTCPILCITGSRDRVNSPGTVKSIAQRYRGRARYEELDGHSHWLIGEPGWEKVAGLALAWLDDLASCDATSAGTQTL